MALSRSMRMCFAICTVEDLPFLQYWSLVELCCRFWPVLYSLYNNWWAMLTVLMYLILPMPLLFFLGSSSPLLMYNEGDGWASFTKFLTGASIVGSLAIPSILKHAGIIFIGRGALTMELSSFMVFGVAISWFLQMNGLLSSLLLSSCNCHSGFFRCQEILLRFHIFIWVE